MSDEFTIAAPPPREPAKKRGGSKHIPAHRRPPPEPSKYQTVIFEEVDTGEGNLLIEAVAGSGKTWTLEQCVRRVKSPGLCIAFNRHIAKEMQRRFRSGMMRVQTVHALCLSTLRNRFPRTEVNDRKYFGWISEAVKRAVQKHESLAEMPVDFLAQTSLRRTWPTYMMRRLLDLVRVNLVDHHDHQAVKEVIRRYRLDLEPPVWDWAAETVEVLIDRGIDQAGKHIDFADMLFLPNYFDVKFQTYPWVFVDEAQDLSRAQTEVALKSVAPDGRLFAVGDRCQCQPGDTLISQPGGRAIALADIQVGDPIVAFQRRSGCFVGTQKSTSRVLRKAARDYIGPLHRVSVESVGETLCTPKHRWLVRWLNKSTDQWCVYLMQRGDRFRIGWCQLFLSKGGFHLAQRARIERADAAWILSIHEDPAEASLAESVTALRWKLPLQPFEPPNGALYYTRENLEAFFSEVEQHEDLKVNAVQCLDHFGRRLDSPFWSRLKDSRHRTTLFETRACNLIPGRMGIPVRQQAGGTGVEWKPIEVGLVPHWEGIVYSLEVDNELYVADGLTTHNSIYGFAGADAESIPRIIERSEAKVLPLSICYRCPTKVIEMAQRYVPQIEAAPDAPEGVVRTISMRDFPGEARPGDLVLCRMMAPLIDAAFELILKNRKAVVRGRDIGRDLNNLIGKLTRTRDYRDYTSLGFVLTKWRNERIAQILEINGGDREDMAIQSVKDRARSVEVLWKRSEARNEQELQELIGDLFSDNRTGVTFSTVHRAKGLEEDRVFILNPSLMPHPKAEAEWELAQERNLIYVAYTRAKRELIFIRADAPPQVVDRKEAVNRATSQLVGEPVPEGGEEEALKELVLRQGMEADLERGEKS